MSCKEIMTDVRKTRLCDIEYEFVADDVVDKFEAKSVFKSNCASLFVEHESLVDFGIDIILFRMSDTQFF